MSTETELKFRIPAARLAAVRRAVATRTAVIEPLAAVYFDTPDEHLAQAQVALRLRLEAGGWVQTLKAEGALALQRLEHNVALPSAGASGPGAANLRPALDLSLHADSEAGAVLARVLKRVPAQDSAGGVLVARYATEVRRTHRVLRFEGARIELALDEGRIIAGDAVCGVCEIEFELLSGPPRALLSLAARWAARFGLVLDVRSKSERGHRLALGQRSSRPSQARPLKLPRRAAAGAALAAMLGNALGQVLANASPLAELAELAELTEPSAAAEVGEAGPGSAADRQPDPELLHQLRVGLRRLRTVLQVFGPLLPPAVTGLDDAARHRLRRRIKRLRYATELTLALWPAKPAARLLHCLAQAQTPLGDFNDCVVAQAQYRNLAAQDPLAWFAVGWLSARRQLLEPACSQAMARLAEARVGWRR